MAATITITCPECDKQLKAPAEIAGKKIRCKSCGATFVAKGAPAGKGGGQEKQEKPAKAKAKPKPGDEDEDDNNPYGMQDVSLAARCPDCANEMESEDAVICLYCGYNTVTRERSRTRKVREQTGGDIFLWLLPGILCALGVLTLITLNVVYDLNIEDWVDSEAWYSFVGSLGVKVWLGVISAYACYLMGRFAIKRLIINNMPPEIEEKL